MNSTKRQVLRCIAGLAAGSILVAACSSPQEETTAAAPDDTSPPGFDFATWDQYLGGPDSSQYSSLNQINKDNVGRLDVAWTFDAGDGAPNFNPIVVDNVMYVLANRGRDYVALDAATGKEIWRHTTGGVGSRGVNYWQSEDGADRRLIYLEGGMLSELDAETGEPIASFGDNGKVDIRTGFEDEIMADYRANQVQTNNPGRVFEDLIIFSLRAGGASYNSNPADIHAFNILTGELAWVFHTVPREGEFGYDTWPKLDEGYFGGVHNWSESTVDPDLGIIYIPTGTARYDFYGANRKGQDLFGNSLLALNARTGERIWHFQMVHHDLWDYDIPQAPKLLTVTHDGERVKAVAQGTKFGFLYVFNRETGEPLWPVEERPVPASDVPGEEAWPTQPFPTKPPPFARQKFTADEINPYRSEENQAELRENFKTWRNEGLFTPPSLEGTISAPGHNGGANWGSSAVDPVNGRYFVVSKELPTLDKLNDPTANAGGRGGAGPGGGGRGGAGPAGGRGGRGGGFGGRGGQPQAVPGAGPDFVSYSSGVDFMIDNDEGMPAINPPWSQLTAYDLNTGDIIWQVPNGGVYELMQKGIDDTGAMAPRGGPVVTAGGLVFVATSSDRKLRARDTDTGKVVWEYDLPAGSDAVPAVGNGMFSQGLDISPAGPSQYMVFALPTP